MTRKWGTKRSVLEPTPDPQQQATDSAKAAALLLVIIPAELAAGVSSEPRLTGQLNAVRSLTRDSYEGYQARCAGIREQVQRIKLKCQ
jgi:hypothetical protein